MLELKGKYDTAKVPTELELFKSSLKRFDAIANILNRLRFAVKSSGSEKLGIIPCEFCIYKNNTSNSCSNCAWGKEFGVCCDIGSSWWKLSASIEDSCTIASGIWSRILDKIEELKIEELKIEELKIEEKNLTKEQQMFKKKVTEERSLACKHHAMLIKYQNECKHGVVVDGTCDICGKVLR